MEKEISKDNIQKAIDALQKVPKNREVRAVIKRLKNDLVKIKIPKEKTLVTLTHFEKKQIANQRRSNFTKGAWRVVNLVYENYPEQQKLGKMAIYKEFFKRRRGETSEIGDVIWQNLST